MGGDEPQLLIQGLKMFLVKFLQSIDFIGPVVVASPFIGEFCGSLKFIKNNQLMVHDNEYRLTLGGKLHFLQNELVRFRRQIAQMDLGHESKQNVDHVVGCPLFPDVGAANGEDDDVVGSHNDDSFQIRCRSFIQRTKLRCCVANICCNHTKPDYLALMDDTIMSHVPETFSY